MDSFCSAVILVGLLFVSVFGSGPFKFIALASQSQDQQDKRDPIMPLRMTELEKHSMSTDAKIDKLIEGQVANAQAIVELKGKIDGATQAMIGIVSLLSLIFAGYAAMAKKR